jgi:molybdopterin-guanine dinucleotide biosynthesis protein
MAINGAATSRSCSRRSSAQESSTGASSASASIGRKKSSDGASQRPLFGDASFAGCALSASVMARLLGSRRRINSTDACHRFLRLLGLRQDDARRAAHRSPAPGGQRVSVVKHAHHDFDIDHEGKDSWRHRQAGAFEVVIASNRRLAKIREFPTIEEPTFDQLVAELVECDWVLVEGFKHAPLPKIEVWRAATGSPRNIRSIRS